MKKQNAIIALLLIVSLLVSSMTILVSAATPTGDTQSNAATGVTQNTESEETLRMKETLVSTKNGKVDGAARPIYATDGPNAIVPNILDGMNANLGVSVDNEGSGYGILDTYDIVYGNDKFVRFNVSAAGLEANGGKIKRDVKLSISSGAYGYFNLTGVAGSMEDTLASAEGYFVYDYEFATEYLIPSINFMPIVRAGVGGSYSLATQVNLNMDNFASYMRGGKWAHFTIIGDVKNNAMYVFVNGVLANSSKIITKLPDNTIAYDSLRIEGIRISTSNVVGNPSMNLYVDNVAARYYNSDQAARASLDTALANKDISRFADHYEDKGTILPPVAKVNGVVYNTVTEVGDVLTGNTDTPYQVDILRAFAGTITVAADAVINTYGLVGLDNFVFSEDTHYEMEDGYITVDAPFVSNSLSQKPNSSVEYTGVSISGVAGNLASGISQAVNDNILVLKNVDNGSQCVEFNFLNASLSYVNAYGFSSSYKLVDYPYGIFAFDLVSFSSNMKGGFYMLGRASSGPLSWPQLHFTTLLSGIPVGEVAQFTIAYGLKDAATGTYEVRIFRNGKYLTNASFKTTEADARFEALRFQPSGGHFALDNIYSVPSATTVFDADGNLLDAFNQFNKPGYDKLSLPSVASVDGVLASAADQVTALLDANALVYQQSVSINHKFTGTIKVNVGAVIETNGFVGLDSFVFGEGVQYQQIGTKIITKASLNFDDKVETSDISKSGFTFPLNDVTASDNELVSSISVGGEQTTNYLKVNTVTNAYDGSKYYGIITNPDYLVNSTTATPNKYVSISINKTIKVDASAGSIADILKTADEQYLVFDIDISTKNSFLSGFDITTTPRWASDTSSNIGFANSNGLRITEKIGKSPADWVHITAVYDVRNNIRYIYVNGEYSFTASFVDQAPPAGATGINLQHIRLNIPDKATLSEDMSLYFDNVSMREFDASETALIEAINNNSALTTWDKNHEGKSSQNDAAIRASVDGKAFTSVEEAVKYAFDNKAKQLSIYDEYNGVVEITHDIKIYVMNGEFKYISKDYAVTEEDGLYTFKKDDRALNTVYVVYDRFAFEDNGGVSGYEAVKFGSGSQFVYHNDAFVNTTYYNGKYYTFNGKWAYETNDGVCEFAGAVTDDCNFKLLIPQYDTVDAECMFSYKLNGGEITLANSVGELRALLNGEYTTLEVTLYEDVVCSEGIEVNGELTLNLNGNDLIFTSISGAGFTLAEDDSSLALSSAKAGASVHYTNEACTASDYLVAITGNNCSLTVNGRNLSVYAGALVSDSTGTGNTVTITGGTFYRVLSAMYSYVTVKGGTNVNITSATFVDTLNNGVWFATAANDDAVFDNVAININRCTVIGLDGTALVREGQDKNGNYAAITFENLTYIANGGRFSYDDNVSDAVSVGTGSFTNVEIPEEAIADGLKLLYQNKSYTNKLYYPAYVNGTADYTLTESQYSGAATYKISSPYAITVNGMKYNLTLYSHFNVNIYIPVSETNKFVEGTFDGVATRDIDGVEHYVLTKSVNANSVGDDVTFRFMLVNNEEYVVTANIVDYAANVLVNTKKDDASYTAQLMVAMLEYASSVYAYENKDNTELLEVIDANEKYKSTTDGFGSAVNTEPLKQFLTSASMYLHESPSFIFKLRDDFVGTVKVECGTFANTVNSAQSRTIVLSGLRITDVQNTITLTFTSANGQSVVCTYNLATYYQGLEGNDVATIVLNSLRNYSNVARAYVMAANNK